MSKNAVCSIISKNYISFARTFSDSYKKHNPGSEVYVLLVDRVDGYFDPKAENFKLVEIEEIGIEGLNELAFKYNIIELNTAVKPFFLEHLLVKYGIQKLIYFDPDILILGSVERLWKQLEENSIILTPHLTEPLDDNFRPNEFDLLISGSFNLGFIGVKEGPSVARFLPWWQDKLKKYCYVDHIRGYFVDQKWVDLVPGLFEGVHIITDPGCNTAYWNLHSRTIEKKDEGIYINGKHAVFFHFSGFSPKDIESVSKNQDRFTLEKRSDLRPLFEEYRDLVLKNGYSETISWPYAFSSFDNGVPIPDVARKIYIYLPPDISKKFGDPFKAGGKDSYFSWLNEKVSDVQNEKGVKRLWFEVYKARAEARAMFPDLFSEDWAGFMQWCESVADFEQKIPEIFKPDEKDMSASKEILDLRALAYKCQNIIDEKERVIQEKERVIQENELSIQELIRAAYSQQQTIDSLLNSLSWKITKPLRWLSGKVKGL